MKFKLTDLEIDFTIFTLAFLTTGTLSYFINTEISFCLMFVSALSFFMLAGLFILDRL